ncbi:zinc-dependent peptidase [Teredinibacter haidensis]|uniref:M90 family metallopeptidase n=1 Tax=Teredinibacter haidensis TaxID=2731755 RepID=UPI000948FC2B|nr:M90 family metallopeptidase [Teredinibacter haidensis]
MSLTQQWFLFLGAGLVLAAVWFGVKRLRYRLAVGRAFPAAWQQILRQRLPVYDRLTPELRAELEHLILHFLYTKRFEGCAGLEMTDEIRVVIAAEACLLILNRPSRRYAGLRYIYVYPSTFVARRDRQDEYGVVSKATTHLLGESWSNGRVVLAWDSVERGRANFTDGQNVVLHEFAHQLDQEDGNADGAPLLYTRDSYSIWSQVFSREFDTHQRQLMAGDQTLIDAYGATNPAEFFAVVTELFFERPALMQQRHPALYGQLQQYYRLDPMLWAE